MYVQDRLREQGAEVARLLTEQGGFFFVCGDGAKMTRDVQAALEDVLQKHAKMTKPVRC